MKVLSARVSPLLQEFGPPSRSPQPLQEYEAGLYKAATDAPKLKAQLAGLLVERRDTKVDTTGTVKVLHAPTVAARTEEEWLKSVADYYADQGKPDPGANDHAH